MKEKGKEFVERLKKSHEFFSKALEKEDKEVKPIKKGEIPKLAVLLGLLDPFYYDLYQMCDGQRDIETLSETLGLEPEEVKIFIDKLVKNGLIEKPEGV